MKSKKNINEEKNQEILRLFNLKKIVEAKKKAKDLLDINPRDHILLNIFGAILASEGDTDKAIIYYKKSLELKPNYAEAYNNLGTAYQTIYNLDEAILNYKKALKYKSNFAEAYNNLGSAFQRLGMFKDAIHSFKEAIKVKPEYEVAYSNLGNTLIELGEFENAITNFKKALKINSAYADAYNNMGNALAKLNKFNEAILNHREALKINPKFAEAYNSLGNTFVEMEKFEEAILNYKSALKINPKYSEADFNESLVRLAQGNFELGWKKYESRFEKISDIRKDIGSVTSMRYKVKDIWDGNYLDGTLVVWGEQGIGDHIFFGSMVPDLKKYAKKIILEIDKRLVALFKRYFEKNNFSNLQVKSIDDRLTRGFDKHIAIGSLGQFLRKSKQSFKNTPKKYLTSLASKENEIRKDFLSKDKFKIGVSWKTLNKKQQFRNVSLEQMLSTFPNDKFDIINLQFGECDEELQQIFLNHKINIKTIKSIDNFNDIESFAALISCLDLVITIQNSTAHLSCALGKNTWIMLAKNARWHWLINEKKSLWYPTAKLFRQQEKGNWNTVINSISMELKKIKNY